MMGPPGILSRSLTIAPREKITGGLNSVCEFSKFFAPPCTSCHMHIYAYDKISILLCMQIYTEKRDYTVKDVTYLIVNCACNIVFIISMNDMHAWHDVRVSSVVLSQSTVKGLCYFFFASDC